MALWQKKLRLGDTPALFSEIGNWRRWSCGGGEGGGELSLFI